ncbi:MAG TPA: hypothetical protein VFZ97_03200 [Acidimicrobiales bacterium]
MHSYETGPYGAGPTYRVVGNDEDEHRRPSVFSLVALIAVIAIAAALVLGLVFLILGTLFSLAGAILKVAILVAVAALIWRRVMRRRCSNRI